MALRISKSKKAKGAIQINSNILFRTSAPEVISILNLEDSSSYYKIWGLATKVWESIDGKRSASDIIKKLEKDIKPHSSDLFVKDVQKHLEDFKKQNLIYLSE